MGKKWHFASPELRNELPSDPSQLLEKAVIVKQNPARDVRMNSGYFIKTDRRKCHGFKKEFEAAAKLSASGIDVVEHLAYGSCQAGNILITRAFENSVSAGEYLEQHGADENFLSAWEDFLTRWDNAGFHHPDPHAGNVLYRVSDNRLTLVDLHGIRRRFFWEKFPKNLPHPDTAKFIHALHGWVARSVILKLLAAHGADDPEKTLAELNRNMVKSRLAEWPRRQRQLFAAYPKFSRKEGNLLISASFKGKLDPAAFEAVPDAPSRLSASLFLKLLRIPHRQVIAADPAARMVCYEPMPQEKFSGDPAEVTGFNTILELCGLPQPNPEHWVNHGALPALYHLDDIITSPLFSNRKD